MIYSITGLLESKEANKAIVNTNGISYELIISVNTFSKLPDLKQEIVIYTHPIFKEDMIALFGFSSIEEKNMFLLLNKVSKIGPKLAIAILSGISTEDLKKTIINSDINLLSSIPGIGKKTAERIVLELKDKFKDEIFVSGGSNTSYFQDVVSALVNLGYKKQAAESIVKKLSKDYTEFEPLLKACLKMLVK
jgi:Holliday junction DNA helicase RuvA